MKNRGLLLLVAILFASCNTKNRAELVNPFIGTDAHGHTFPGATTPFGLVQVSPDTGTDGWDWVSGYHSSDNSIIGFSHSHLSGTGAADLGDILLMPAIGEVRFESGTKQDPEKGYRSRFNHKTEKAHAGYYQVYLEDAKTKVQLTATSRAAYHRYIFDDTRNQHIILDLKHGIQDNVFSGQIVKIDKNRLEGYRRSKGWADDHTVFFAMEFSQPINKIITKIDGVEYTDKKYNQGKEVVAALMFDDVDEVEIKVGISYVDQKGAKQNLETEIANKSFEMVLREAERTWDTALGKIEVEGEYDDKVIFYTALYHTMIAPYVMSDVDGRYRGSDRKIHIDTTHTNYGLFSLWDTFRALHPLLTIIEPDKNQEFIQSMIRYYDQKGRLPVWDLNMRETNTMIGYHAVPVIADAYMKGQRNFDTIKALEAMIHSASQQDYEGLEYYRHYGFLPYDKENNSVSKALEYSYDDWTIAQMAKKMGRMDIYNQYIKRAQYYKNHFDPQDGFMKGRNSHGALRDPFNPVEISILGQGDFTEGNSWHYSFFTPQDVNTHIEMIGGDKIYIAKLDELFNSESVRADHSPDVTGLIGNYAQGNEPSHHVAYLYNYAGAPWKTQNIIAQIKQEMYTNERDGLSGNEDCGQMSAWYVLSAMGFYPVTPASNIYVIGTPTFKKVTINLDNGNKFIIRAKNVSKENIYIQSTTFNDTEYDRSYITHQMLEQGGELKFVMDNEPNKQWGSETQSRPQSKIKESVSSKEMLEEIIFEPYIKESNRVFQGAMQITPVATSKDATIHYTLNGTEPTIKSPIAKSKINISTDRVLKLKSIAKDGTESSTGIYKLYKGLLSNTIIKGTEPSKPYVNGGLKALNNGKTGGENYKDAEWIGYVDTTAVLTTTFDTKRAIRRVGFNAINSPGSWLLLPFQAKAEIYNGKRKVKTINFKIPNSKDVPEGTYYFSKPTFSYGDKIVWTITGGKLPEWHTSKGKGAWMFIDELTAY